jgi:hypothetical protein
MAGVWDSIREFDQHDIGVLGHPLEHDPAAIRTDIERPPRNGFGLRWEAGQLANVTTGQVQQVKVAAPGLIHDAFAAGNKTLAAGPDLDWRHRDRRPVRLNGQQRRGACDDRTL